MIPLNFILFVQIILFLFITPGSPRILIVSYSMSYGIKKTVWTALGDISANTVQMIIVTFFIGSLLIQYPQILIVIKWLGVSYLVYLSYELFKAKVKQINSVKEIIFKSNLSFFRDGFVVAGLSPKALIFFGAIFPNFIDFNKNYISQFMILAFTYVLLDFITLMIYGLGARKISLWLQTNPKTINLISSAALLIIALITALIKL
jgi:threonine/homoserine/homoserine lactone efflux protein